MNDLIGFFKTIDIDSIFFTLLKITGFVLVILILIFISRKLIIVLGKRILHKTHFKWDHFLYENKIFESLSYVFPLLVGSSISKFFFKKKELLKGEFDFIPLLDKVFSVLIAGVFLQFLLRVINFIMQIAIRDEKNHQSIAVKAFFQILKIFFILGGGLTIISILIESNLSNIITSLGALTAIFILVFKDSILGFISGIQIAANKMVKVGDWVSIFKYQIEGNITEINLLSAKIENFDKTISIVPTYDLVSSAITNYEILHQRSIRRIKRSLLFNTHTLDFSKEEAIEKFKKFQLLSPYIKQRQEEIKRFNEIKNIDTSITINGRRLTNIGLFREYATLYLKNHPEIDQGQIIMTRQLEPTPYGLPLEIYCFTNTSIWIEYERIQSDVFDHLMSAAKEFDLELIQIISLNKESYHPLDMKKK